MKHLELVKKGCASGFTLLLWPDKFRPVFAISKKHEAGKTVQDKGEVGPTNLLVIVVLITNYLTVSIVVKISVKRSPLTMLFTTPKNLIGILDFTFQEGYSERACAQIAIQLLVSGE